MENISDELILASKNGEIDLVHQILANKNIDINCKDI